MALAEEEGIERWIAAGRQLPAAAVLGRVGRMVAQPIPAVFAGFVVFLPVKNHQAGVGIRQMRRGRFTSGRRFARFAFLVSPSQQQTGVRTRWAALFAGLAIGAACRKGSWR